MTPEAVRFLEKAEKLLTDADMMLGIGLYDAAGRTAYLAGFHVAQAFLFERTKKVFKTHKGVQAEFYRLTMGASDLDEVLKGFLSRTYNLKALADYETGPGSEVSPERATEAVTTAKRFVAHFAGRIETTTNPAPEPPAVAS
jgi:uncharacterized protein (UPF0332 family)